MRVPELATPANDAELFETDPETLRFGAFMTGDVFSGVKLGADDETGDVAIAGHPCVIRGSGGQLMTRVPCCLLKETAQAIPYEEWPDGHFDKFPFPDSLGLGTNQSVRLLEWVSVHKREFVRDRRKLALTERGVYVFQQRLTHALTRVAIPLPNYEASSKSEVREAALEIEWVEMMVGENADDQAIAASVKQFHKFLDGSAQPGGPPRRALLRTPGGESALAKLVRIELE